MIKEAMVRCEFSGVVLTPSKKYIFNPRTTLSKGLFLLESKLPLSIKRPIGSVNTFLLPMDENEPCPQMYSFEFVNVLILYVCMYSCIHACSY
jgi:hypothetical protein